MQLAGAVETSGEFKVEGELRTLYLKMQMFKEIKDLATQTGGCVLPFDPLVGQNMKDTLNAISVMTVRGLQYIRQNQKFVRGASLLLQVLRD
jgi:hypothetical protein